MDKINAARGKAKNDKYLLMCASKTLSKINLKEFDKTLRKISIRRLKIKKYNALPLLLNIILDCIKKFNMITKSVDKATEYK